MYEFVSDKNFDKKNDSKDPKFEDICNRYLNF